ncbi:DUF885 domain-containing protein [Pedobacter sp. HDW13]|uniref:DUF885 family protein n=1 Tax=unclassified Pedobacter TaxID=2628915 RepID=UPI000F5A881B|nr:MULTISPECIES: DUF885 family protein [unclassified Pedobacter]QIL38938.1 DUF885 domain-containing protein [Pedobacter sp. HDW13]RQO72578.1 DUF885 domain-containing protein [Pedobacter sp. KBW01]
MRKLYFLFLILTITLNLQAQTNEASLVSPLINQYQSDKNMFNRKYNFKRAEEYFKRMTQFYAGWQKQLSTLPFNKLTVNERVDYILLKRDIRSDSASLQQNYAEFKTSIFALPFAQTLIDFEAKRRVGQQQDGKAMQQQFEQLREDIRKTTKAVEQKNLEITPVQASWAQQTVNQYLAVFTEAYKFYDGYDPQFTKATKGVYPEVTGALQAYADVLGKMARPSNAADDGSGIIGNPIGRPVLLSKLKDEMIAYTPEQIEAIAMREFAWCDAEMLKASQQMGFGNDWKKALEKVKTDYPELGKQPELVYELANEAINFVEKHNLITIPPLAKEGWQMRMLTPKEQLFAPFFLGGESVLIAYPTEDMSEKAKMMTLRGNNRHFSRAVVFHELIPGHNLQYFMQSRYKPYRKVFSTPFWTEGWSLYWEMLLWDQNFPKSPEDKIGMLFWRMHRCARIIFSMNYHLGKWTPKQCIDFLVDRVGFERANAEAEVRRSFTGGYGPLYQIGYMLGGLQFRALHKELVQSGKMTNIQFHDRILHENNMPVEMVRALLTNQQLPENFSTRWKFAGDIK